MSFTDKEKKYIDTGVAQNGIADKLLKVRAEGRVVMDSQDKDITVEGILSTDRVIVTLNKDDTGAALGQIVADWQAKDTLRISSANLPTNNDGEVSYLVIE